MRDYVAVNERGLRIGEDHQNAVLTDAEVELVRMLHSEGMSYRDIAAKFEIGKSTVADICKYRRRGQTISAWKRVRVLQE
jgi:transposase